MSFSSLLKVGVKRSITLPAVRAPFQRMMRNHATIFLLHRFRDPDNGIEGLDPQVLRRTLQYLRKKDIQIKSLLQLVEDIENGEPLNGAVAFTMDDGYRQQGTIGEPLFAEFDCPVTLFVTTGFIDGQLWPWWDQIDYVYTNAKKQLLLNLRKREEFIESCKAMADEERLRAIAELARIAEMELPSAAPPLYQPLSWDELRSLERGGMSCAPHSVSHPVLSCESAERSGKEIKDSWERLREELQAPVPVFAYPVGREQDFSERETTTVRTLGLRAAVTASHRYATSSREQLFMLPRLVLPEDETSLAAVLGGIEHLRRAVGR